MANDKPIIDPTNILTDEQLEKLYDEVVEDNLVEKFKAEFINTFMPDVDDESVEIEVNDESMEKMRDLFKRIMNN